MKFYLYPIIAIMLFSSCLKQSIPDAMLGSKNSGNKNATLSYKINGNDVNISVPGADYQNSYGYETLSCSKSRNYYSLGGVSNTGEIVFTFYTDSLTVGVYRRAFAYDDPFVAEYNGINGYIYAASDSITVNITSYDKGHISGNFAGVLTPVIIAGNPDNTYGTASSVLITNGSFKNVPVFY